MKIVYKKYMKWSSLQGIILYTGTGPNGKTLSAVRQLVEEKDARPILSNAHLSNLGSKLFSTSKIGQYKNKRIFLDAAEMVVTSRSTMSRVNRLMTYFFTMQGKLNNKIILTSPRIDYLDKRVRMLIGPIFEPYYFVNKYGTPKIQLRRYYYRTKLDPRYPKKEERYITYLHHIVEYPTVNARKYFKYFNTKECPRVEGALI